MKNCVVIGEKFLQKEIEMLEELNFLSIFSQIQVPVKSFSKRIKCTVLFQGLSCAQVLSLISYPLRTRIARGLNVAFYIDVAGHVHAM